MWFLPCAIVVVILADASRAQSHVSSPPGFLASPGGDEATQFGAASFGRSILVDGEFRHQAMVLRAVDYRPLPKFYSPGRTFKNVTLQAGECDFDQIDWSGGAVHFSTVPTRTPTTVFAASLTWPETRPTSPSDWRVQFPFKTPWVYPGRQDICLDHSFSGGTLLGGTVPWWKYHHIPYYLDATPMEFSRHAGGSTIIRARHCQDTAKTNRSQISLDIVSHGPMYPDFPPNRDRITVSVHADIGPNAVVVHMLSLAGSRTGVPTPLVKCEDLFLDLSLPTLYTFTRAVGRGVSSVDYRIPYDARWGGTQVWAQSAWGDSSSGELKLTAYRTAAVPRLPDFYRRGVIEALDGSSPRGGGRLAASYVPVARYTR